MFVSRLHEKRFPSLRMCTKPVSSLLAPVYSTCIMTVGNSQQRLSSCMPVTAHAALRNVGSHSHLSLMLLKVKISLVFATFALNNKKWVHGMRLASVNRLLPALSNMALEKTLQPPSTEPCCVQVSILPETTKAGPVVAPSTPAQVLVEAALQFRKLVVPGESE